MRRDRARRSRSLSCALSTASKSGSSTSPKRSDPVSLEDEPVAIGRRWQERLVWRQLETAQRTTGARGRCTSLTRPRRRRRGEGSVTDEVSWSTNTKISASAEAWRARLAPAGPAATITTSTTPLPFGWCSSVAATCEHHWSQVPFVAGLVPRWADKWSPQESGNASRSSRWSPCSSTRRELARRKSEVQRAASIRFGTPPAGVRRPASGAVMGHGWSVSDRGRGRCRRGRLGRRRSVGRPT